MPVQQVGDSLPKPLLYIKHRIKPTIRFAGSSVCFALQPFGIMSSTLGWVRETAIGRVEDDNKLGCPSIDTRIVVCLWMKVFY
jgi:hypothetical protein